MSIKDDLKEAKEEIQELKGQSLAMELLHQSKKTNQRLFIVWLVTFIAFIGLLGYTIFLLNDIGTIETTSQEISDVDTIENSNVANGDIYGEDKTNKN